MKFLDVDFDLQVLIGDGSWLSADVFPHDATADIISEAFELSVSSGLKGKKNISSAFGEGP